MTMPPPEPPPSAPRRRPVYYPAGIGWLYSAAVLLLVWILMGLLFHPIGWPWWW